MPNRLLSKQQLKEDHPHRPHVHLGTYQGGALRLIEALRGLVPVGAYPLGGELYFFFVFLHFLAQAEIGDFDLPIVEKNVLRLQIVMNYFLLLVIQVLQTAQDLTNYQLSLLLRNYLVLLQVKVQVRTRTQF